MKASSSTSRLTAGAAAWASVDKVNGELFSLTYGALVRQLLNDYEDCVEDVNTQLEKMGYNIGIRLVDEFLAKTNSGRCNDFRETADVIAKVALKMFLGVGASVGGWNAQGTECTVVLEENPFAEFVELPEQYSGLSYCNLLCGVLRGALEMVSLRVKVSWSKDMLQGDDAYELKIQLLEVVSEEYPYDGET